MNTFSNNQANSLVNKNDQVDNEALFPIGTLSSKTGVKTVTLRAWERRYGLLKPQRTPKGHRLFSMSDVERVNQVLNLLEQGISVNRVGKILDSDSALPNLVSIQPDSKASEDDPWRHFNEQFRLLIEKLDSRSLDRAFSEVSSLYSLDLLAKKLILPLYSELQQQTALLPSLVAEQAFLHEFLVAKLGAAYLRNNQNLSREHKSLLFVAGANPRTSIKALLLANAINVHGYESCFIGHLNSLDALPVLLQRTEPDALVLVGNEFDWPTIKVLGKHKSLHIFVECIDCSDDSSLAEAIVDDEIPKNKTSSVTRSASFLHVLHSDLSKASSQIHQALEQKS